MEGDGQTSRPSHVPYERYRKVLEEMSSLKMEALHREEEIQTLEAMLAQKDWEMVRLKDQLLLRDTTISKLRSVVELAWTEFDSVNKRNINPQASAIEKHDEEETIQDINGTASIIVTNQDGNTTTSAHVCSVQGERPSLVSTFNGPQPPPTDAKIPRAVGPILSVFNPKGRPPLPPPQPQRPPRPQPYGEANIVGATPSPVHAFNIAPPPRMEANIVGAAPSPVHVFNIASPPRMEANIVGATPSLVRALNITPSLRKEADITGAIQSPVLK
ncbi:hypothetical protein SADUNF_Sadunf18G0095600 [Salix dunnii]|uniref:Uncharacterized protein n=1 Tax=Salix dunnii TaxID=1413687 RepID=A0A835J409_9ROSI|nr:hypothetical protein SADUNF_Sadunf18G0095600 [Salix dunnii]